MTTNFNKIIYIHIGYPKTGTKFLSRKFFSNHPKIKNFGKEYSILDIKPELLLSFNKIMHSKKINLNGKKNIIKVFKNLKLSNNKVNFISYEGFTQLNLYIKQEKIFQRLKYFFQQAKINIKIFVTIRSQVEMIPTHFANAPKLYAQIPLKKFKDYKNQINLNKRNVNQKVKICFERLKYYKLYNCLVKLFGKNNIKIFLIEDLRENQKYFFKELCSFLKLGDHKISKVSNANPENVTRRKNNEYLRINKYVIKKLNNSIIFKTFVLPFPANLKRKIYIYVANLIIDIFNFFDPIVLNDQEIIKIKKYYNKDNQKLMRILKNNLIKENYL
ncbi:hypothetical protein IDH15_00260 [Pelagibacterales bacterium SAG-MED38]|nr:hypothetical protein [Pelagibacterales bacterium SAG-MED38]